MTVEKKITLVPLGGLANRMRAIAAGYALARATEMGLDVIWLRNKDLNAPFHALFRPLGHAINLTECSRFDALVKYNVPLKRNFYLPSIYQRRHFAPRLDDTGLPALLDRPEETASLVSSGKSLIASGLSFFPTDNHLFRELFVPTAEIAAEIERRCSTFPANTIGLHIRRTDNTVAIAESPATLFLQQMEQEVQNDADTHFYLATDSETIKEQLHAHFGTRILTSPSRADRRSVEGMKEAVVELYTLARTRRFYGTYYSSFSDLAAILTDHPHTILRKEPQS